MTRSIDFDETGTAMDETIEVDAMIEASISRKMAIQVHGVNDPVTKWLLLQRFCIQC